MGREFSNGPMTAIWVSTRLEWISVSEILISSNFIKLPEQKGRESQLWPFTSYKYLQPHCGMYNPIEITSSY